MQQEVFYHFLRNTDKDFVCAYAVGKVRGQS